MCLLASSDRLRSHLVAVPVWVDKATAGRLAEPRGRVLLLHGKGSTFTCVVKCLTERSCLEERHTCEPVFAVFLFQQTLDVNKKLNCCTGILLESLDQLETVSNKEGLLYGVPVSIKENIAYKVFCSYLLPASLQDGNYTVQLLWHSWCSSGLCVACSYLTPLLSLPVFIWQHKNHDCSCGVIINLDQPAQKDSVLVEVLKRQGAIPFVKTNLPQGLLK